MQVQHFLIKRLSLWVGALLPTYLNGYKGAVLKTDVPWRTWSVGSNPTVGVTPAVVYLPKSIPAAAGQ